MRNRERNGKKDRKKIVRKIIQDAKRKIKRQSDVCLCMNKNIKRNRKKRDRESER